MLILHASWCEGELLLWSESDGKAKKGGRAKQGALRWDGGLSTLAGAIEPWITTFRKVSAVAWLPSTPNGPLHSSPLFGDSPAGDDEVALIPWIVTAAAADPVALEPLFAECAAKRDSGVNLLAPGLVIGDSLAFWTEATRFAYSLVARQQFLPTLVKTDEGYEARWKATPTRQDGKSFLELATAMPGSARALTATADDPPDRPARLVLSAFLDHVADRLVRQASAKTARGVPESPHDAWLQALVSTDARVHADAAKLRVLADQLRDWERPIRTEASAPYRLCFRLGEPEPGSQSEDWNVEYLLQGSADLTLLLPAAEVWGTKQKKSAAASVAPAAREHLLMSLGQAAGISPRVETSLKQRDPEGFAMDAAGAHEFLSSTASALEQSGFGVLLPSWWTGRGPAQRLSARASVKGKGMSAGQGLTLASIVEFDWKVAIGDTELTLAELQALAKLKAPLVRLRGQWVEVNGEEIRTAIEYLRKKASGAASVRDVIRMALGAGTPGPLFVSGVDAEGWIGELLDHLRGKRSFSEIDPPAGLSATLRAYQLRGYSWLEFLTQLGLGACLADDMGLGKTIQTLSLLQRREENGENGGLPTLLVCPTSVVGNWVKEAARFVPGFPVMVHHGTGRAKGSAFAAQAAQHRLVISSYALLHRDLEMLKSVEWDGVVLDEAQNIKNAGTLQSQAARTVASRYRIALTGTPVENNVGDLWSLFEFLNPGWLGPQAEFRRRYFIPIQMNRDTGAAERLKKLTGPFVLRRLKTDKSIISDLPEKLEMKVFCNLTKEQVSLYKAVVKEAEDALEGVDGIERKGIVLATLSKLKQVCNHPAQFSKDAAGALAGRSGKLARLSEMLEEVLSVGDRALIFTQFSEMGELLKRHLQETFGREVLFLHGGVPKKQRDAMVERFTSANGPPVFLLSLKAGGTGLNLVNANHVFHFDRWWNPAVENQATDRAFRIGQTRNVQVHKFVCAGTLEDKIDAMIERKKDVAESVVGTGEGWLTELSNAELRSLFALGAEALGE